MLAYTLQMALAATLQASAPPPAVQARAQTQVVVQIIQAAEVRGGRSDTPHQRSVRRDEETGERLVLLQFE